MGYVHATHMSTFITPAQVTATVGTWAMAAASNVWTLNKTAADNTSVIKIPCRLPGNASGWKGARLKSVDVWYSIATAACDAISTALYCSTLPAQSGTLSAGLVATSYDSAHDTAAERLAVDQHKLTLTLTTAPWVDEDSEYYVELTVDAAASSVVKFQGARVNYDLRI